MRLRGVNWAWGASAMLRPRVLLPTFSASKSAGNVEPGGDDSKKSRSRNIIYDCTVIVGRPANLLLLSALFLTAAFYLLLMDHGTNLDAKPSTSSSGDQTSQTLPKPLKDYRTVPIIYEKTDPSVPYPRLTPLSLIYGAWPQDEHLEGAFTEHLRVFDFQDPEEMKQAERLRNMELPFKVNNVPELIAAGSKWNQEGYLSSVLDPNAPFSLRSHQPRKRTKTRHYRPYSSPPDTAISKVSYSVEVSPSNFFTWFDNRAVRHYKENVDPSYVKPTRHAKMKSGEVRTCESRSDKLKFLFFFQSRF